MAVEGDITIEIKASTDKFDRQIAELEKKMQKEEDKKILIETKLSGQEEELEKARQKTDELADAYQRLKSVQDAVNTGKATPAQFTAFQDIQSTYGSLEQLGTQFDKALSKQDAIEQKVAQTKYRYDEINAKVSEYKQKIENVKIQKQVSDVDKLKNSFNSVGSSIQNSIKNVARLALGIFGVRTAYLALARASSNLASYDQQYAANIEYIRYALTQMIAPVLQWIVRLAATLLGYINAILQGWFGINLFSRGSAENFNKMKAGASGVSKAVKEIKKQLTGFDEINMLTDQSDTGTSAGAGGVGMPSFDLSAMQGEVPPWLQWIIDHKDEILSTLGGIAAGLLALKFGLGGIKALGIGLLIKGIIDFIKDLKKYLEEPSWKNFGKIIKDIGLIILGLGILIGNVPLIVAGAIVLIIGIIIKHWEKIKSFLQGGIDWLTEKSDWVHYMFGDVIGSIYDAIVNMLQGALNYANSFFTSLKNIFDGIIMFLKGVFTGNWKMAFEGLKQIVFNIFNIIFSRIQLIFNTITNFIGGKINAIISLFSGLASKIIGFFSVIATKVPEVISSKFKSVINAVLRAVENILNKPIGAINNLIETINTLPGVSMSRLHNFSFPRLKSGGIINMPNKGTMVGGSAIAGESGREGVLPLTDQQAMAELGAEIGRHVLINLTNITQMNGRVIGRELRQIQSEQEFAFNT